MKWQFTLLSVSTLFLIACSHAPSTGERILAQSGETKILGEQWLRGEGSVAESAKLEKNGNKLISSGNKKINQGKKLISKGENEVSKGSDMVALAREKLSLGQKLKSDSESEFNTRFPGKLNPQS